MKQVSEGLPFTPTGTPTIQVLERLLPILDRVLREHGARLNRVLPKDGSEAMTGPLRLKAYTTLTLPAAADWAGAILYVSDAAAGSKFQGSDGVAWVALG